MHSNVQNLVTLFGGIVIAFINGWKMTLVVLSCIPLIMFAAVVSVAPAACSVAGKSTRNVWEHGAGGHVALSCIMFAAVANAGNG